LPLLFRVKAWVDRCAALTGLLPKRLSDRLLQAGSLLLPKHLPYRVCDFRNRYEHHLILTVADDAIEPTYDVLSAMFPSNSGDVFECSEAEAKSAMLHRFAVAGAAIRYRTLAPETVEDVVAIDVALRRDERDWFERLPPELNEQIVAKL